MTYLQKSFSAKKLFTPNLLTVIHQKFYENVFYSELCSSAEQSQFTFNKKLIKVGTYRPPMYFKADNLITFFRKYDHYGEIVSIKETVILLVETIRKIFKA